MPSIDVPQVIAAFAVDGGASGSIQVASSAGFFPGCIAYLWRNDLQARCIIVEVPDATHVRVRIIADDNEDQQKIQIYGGTSNLTGWTVAKASKLTMPAQLARVESNTLVAIKGQAY
jgi:hypothetical protein